jgi:hypothetical protein
MSLQLCHSKAEPIFDPVVLDVILLFQDVSGWKLRKNELKRQKINLNVYMVSNINRKNLPYQIVIKT